MNPVSLGTYTGGEYDEVTLSRTLLQGYNSIALPFNTDVVTLTGRSSNEYDWVAQLSAVTYNQHDGYTMFFQKVDGGVITANQPYVLHLGSEVMNPTWTNLTDGITLAEAQPVTITPQKGYSGYEDWQMTSNFTAGMSMSGLYGIVNRANLTGDEQTDNPDGCLKLGGSGSTLNAFTAYITPPANSGNVKVRTSFLDFGDDGTALENVRMVDEDEVEGYYITDGRRLSSPQKGIVVVKYRDGRRMKVLF